MNLDLDEIRREIDVIDTQIVECFEKRMNIVLKVAEYKAQNNMQVLDASREMQVISNNAARLQNQDYAFALEAVLQELMRVSREMQIKLLKNRLNK